MSDCGCMPEGTEVRMERVTVVSNEQIAEGIWLVTLQSPRIATSVEPGQFVHLRVSEGTSFILRRPFSVHRAQGERIEILFQVLGEGTDALSHKDCGDTMDAIGPLGTGWCVPRAARRVLLVGGGLGAAPLGGLVEELAGRGVETTVALGAPSADRLAGHELFEAHASRVEIATDDGSQGERGFVTRVTERLMPEGYDLVCVCGPQVMERAVAEQAAAAGIACKVSVERLMACGIGACLSCVVQTTSGQKRACVDGPVFDAEDLQWDQEYTLKH